MVYDRTFNFSVREIEIETKKCLGSWITKGKKKSHPTRLTTSKSEVTTPSLFYKNYFFSESQDSY